MPRILAVDFGEKRIGLATSDASATLATPREVLRRQSDEAAVEARRASAAARRSPWSSSVFPVRPMASRAPSPRGSALSPASSTRRTGLPVRFHEETLTSDEAARRLSRTAGREELDAAAAAVLLEDYLQSAERAPR